MKRPHSIPPNLQFEINDAEDEWVFSQKFDYIHGRALVTCFTDPSFVIAEAYKSLAPGGYLELQDGVFPFEYVGEPPTDSAIYKWNEYVVAGAAKAGRPWTNVPHYKRWMEETGFENVVEKTYYLPTSPWPKGRYFKDISMLWQEDMTSGLEGISLKVMGNLGWSVDEIRVFLAAVRDDFKNTNIHCYTPM
jgi:SAM-dependent methyltransferase